MTLPILVYARGIVWLSRLVISQLDTPRVQGASSLNIISVPVILPSSTDFGVVVDTFLRQISEFTRGPFLTLAFHNRLVQSGRICRFTLLISQRRYLRVKHRLQRCLDCRFPDLFSWCIPGYVHYHFRRFACSRKCQYSTIDGQ